jgi:uncharacterized protein with NRDE domain
MCLVVFAHESFSEFPFVLAANRDEYFARPSATAAWWTHEGTEIFGGRDLQKGGTWLGVTRSARVAVVTNVRDATKPVTGTASRGWLVRDALTGAKTATRDSFPSFNLLVADRGVVRYERDDGDASIVVPGVHGLSNHRLDSPWPKVDRAIRTMREMKTPDASALFALLHDDAIARDEDLPATGVPIDVERALSPPFVRLPSVAYGTRCSTVLMRSRDGVIHFEERTFDEHGAVTSVVRESIATSA